uniref:glycosyltransferase family 2 protein n=1 Tax=Flavobacterium sp. TaxID=239 RepID=UPI0040477980
MKTISIVIPVYREAKNLARLYERLEKVTGNLTAYKWQYVLVNDGSPDNSMQILRQMAHTDPKVKVVDLSRNFGKEIALTAGVHEACGCDAVICIDADLQHPPELISTLLDEWQKGAEIIATVRTSIEKQPMLRRIGSHVYYWLMSKISGLEMVSQTTDFRLYDKKVVSAFCRVTERERMFRGIMDWMGFRKVYIEFQADARTEGEAGYSYSKLWQLAINSITSFSLWPLRITGYLGILITSTSGLLMAWMLMNLMFQNKSNFTPLAFVVVMNTFLIGIVLIAIGLVALYIGTIHTEVVNRPLYLIRERLNFSDRN